jgi:hypothetical protein
MTLLGVGDGGNDGTLTTVQNDKRRGQRAGG